MDDLKYRIYQQGQLREFENVCKRCGECCGSQDGDPCVNLIKNRVTGKYYCRIYDDRFGPQNTVSGNVFNCISIRDVARQEPLRPNCTYNGKSKSNS